MVTKNILFTKEEYPEKLNIIKNIAVIVFKPDIWQEMNWGNPLILADQYIKDIYEASKGIVKYNVSNFIEIDSFPKFENNWDFTNSTDYYVKFQRNIIPVTYCDYKETIEKYHKDLPDVDEYWWIGAPWFGFNESQMFGKNPIWCNSFPLKYNSRNKIIMGFNYERGIGEMLESFSHRVESIMLFCEYPAWKQFTKDCGSVHCPPNTTIDYNWGNKNLVETNCDSWYNWPNYENKRKVCACEEWGYGNMRQHHKWWLSHIPANWWQYICNLDIIEKQKNLLKARDILNIPYYNRKFKV